MAISSVRVKINGVWTILLYNEETEMYEGTVTAPAITSYNIPGGYYPITVEAVNDAGTITTKDDTDAEVGEILRLTVVEKIKPVITLETPADGAYIQNSSAAVIFKIEDEAAGSGVKESSILFLLDGSEVPISKTKIENGYRCTYSPESPLPDGPHTINIQAQDNDGNIADPVQSTYAVDTIPPTLDVSSPNYVITNNPECVVRGITNDETSSPVSVQVFLNDEDTGSISLDASGNFEKEITLSEGDNQITIISTDASGRSTEIEKNIKLDTTIPEITNITFEPNPVDTSQLVRITLQVR